MKLSVLARVGLATFVSASVALGSVVAASAAAPVRQTDSHVSTAAVTCAPGRAQCPIRVVIPRGAYSGQARATMTGIHSERWFVVRARAGQTMIVLVEGRGPTRGVVHFPNGQRNGQPGGRVFDGSLPVSGDYRIRVTESLMGNAWRGGVTVVVLIY